MPDESSERNREQVGLAEAEVHRAFGQAFAAAQRLENNIVVLILGLGGVDHHDVHSARGHIVALRGMTLGELVSEVERLAGETNRFQDEALLPMLDAAVDMRNELAHGFFTEKFVETCSTAGCLDLVRELVEIERRLGIVADRVLAALRTIAGVTYADEEQGGEVVQALIAGGRSRRYEVLMKRFTALSRTIEVTGILVAECKGLTASGYRPILAMSDRRLLTVGAFGLCAFVEDAPVVFEAEFGHGEGAWSARVGVPCKVRTKVKITEAWNYNVPLASGWRLEVRPGPGEGVLFDWAIAKSD